MTVDGLHHTFDAYCHEARRLQDEFKSRISVLVGMETEWMRESSKDLIQSLQAKYDLDYLVGSVHHVHGIPIDLDRDRYRQAAERAAERAGNLDRLSNLHNGPEDDEVQLFLDYYDAQMAMLESIQPTVVGHFDLIRYLSHAPDASLKASTAVWSRVRRNLAVVRGYGGFLEINTSGLRKGLAEPYPSADICQEFASMGGRFVLSDDSHCVDHVGFGYRDGLQWLERIGVAQISTLTAEAQSGPARSKISSFESPISDLLREPFFDILREAGDDKHQG